MFNFPRSISGSVQTASGATVAGAKVVDFIFSADFVGTLSGVPFTGTADSSYSFVAPYDDLLGAIPYTVSAGSVRIIILS